ncbi:cytoskeleton protein RodZ [Humidesulfovibrio mexicanus]|uniref:Cytoskeleton protein RodZ n=1 Tax=Humidesulfovibrio mexicanus TaxID=147047 RepID=A0A238XX65_9BACT|nr:helix-turn-helix domain-containing protein [Humidesulfovibrio mexicanus]SNR63280.1 cytoskeleton protein RodZ [Humidesulfovibrio mexicanus]
MNLQELGGLLKIERERRGLSVRDVMDATKISRRNLVALEDGQVGQLPHPVYLKGYVRNYARLVGLDAEPLVAVVDQQSDGDSGYIPQRPTPAASAEPLAEERGVVSQNDVADADAVSAPPQAPKGGEAEDEGRSAPGTPLSKPDKPRRLWPWLLLLAMIGLGVLTFNQCQRIRSEMDQQPPVAANATEDNATASNATEAAAADVNATDTAAFAEPSAATSPDANASAAPLVPVFEPSVAPAPAATQGQPTVPMSSVEVSRKQQNAPETPASAMQELVVIAKPGSICWVEVSEGQRRKTFIIRDGDSRRFEFAKLARVRLGNAGGVSFRLNGSPYPYEGQRGQTATLEIGGR